MPEESQIVIIYVSEPIRITCATFIGGLFCVNDYESYALDELVAWGDDTLHFPWE